MKILVDELAAVAVMDVDCEALREALYKASHLPIAVPNEDLRQAQIKLEHAELAQHALADAVALMATHLLLAKPDEVDKARKAALKAGVPEEDLADVAQFAADAREQLESNVFLVALRAMTAAADLDVGVVELKAKLEEAVAAGIPAVVLGGFYEKLAAAETAQAKATIEDVIKAISDPEAMLQVETAEYREMLPKMNRQLAEAEFAALEAQLDKIDEIRAILEGLREQCYVKGGLLKIGLAKLNMALQDAREQGMPDELLEEYEGRQRAAKEAQDLLAKREQLEGQIKAAAEESAEDSNITALKAELGQLELQIEALKEA